MAIQDRFTGGESEFIYDDTVGAARRRGCPVRRSSRRRRPASASSSRAPWRSCCARSASRRGSRWASRPAASTTRIDAFRVTTEQAHAWVEVLLPRLRVAARSTRRPGGTNVVAYPYLDPTVSVRLLRRTSCANPTAGAGTRPAAHHRVGSIRGRLTSGKRRDVRRSGRSDPARRPADACPTTTRRRSHRGRWLLARGARARAGAGAHPSGARAGAGAGGCARPPASLER